MVAGKRYDLNVAREEARAKRRAEKIGKIVSACVLVLVLSALVAGGWFGWNKWMESRERARQAAEAEQLAAEKAAAERQRLAAERREADRLRREAEKRAAEEKRIAEKKAREEARIAEQKAREEARRQAEEARRQAEEAKQRQQELKDYAYKTLGSIRFSVDDHIVFQEGTDDCFMTEIDGQRWGDLAEAVRSRQPIDFFELLRERSDTGFFTEANYPDRETIARLLDKLDAERFTLVVRLTDRASGRRFVVAGLDPERGFAVPEGCRELKQGGRLAGWTIPFRYGDESPIFVMEPRMKDSIAREWNTLVRGIRKDAAKLTNRDEYAAERIKKELPDFVRSVKIELESPPPEEKSDFSTRREIKPKATMKGSGDIRRMNGPHLRR